MSNEFKPTLQHVESFIINPHRGTAVPISLLIDEDAVHQELRIAQFDRQLKEKRGCLSMIFDPLDLIGEERRKKELSQLETMVTQGLIQTLLDLEREFINMGNEQSLHQYALPKVCDGRKLLDNWGWYCIGGTVNLGEGQKLIIMKDQNLITGSSGYLDRKIVLIGSSGELNIAEVRSWHKGNREVPGLAAVMTELGNINDDRTSQMQADWRLTINHKGNPYNREFNDTNGSRYRIVGIRPFDRNNPFDTQLVTEVMTHAQEAVIEEAFHRVQRNESQAQAGL